MELEQPLGELTIQEIQNSFPMPFSINFPDGNQALT